MRILLDFPSIVKRYAPYYSNCFNVEGYDYFQKAVSGFMVSDHKTIEGINRMFVLNPRHQSNFNRFFFHNKNIDLEQINTCRLRMLQDNEETQF